MSEIYSASNVMVFVVFIFRGKTKFLKNAQKHAQVHGFGTHASNQFDELPTGSVVFVDDAFKRLAQMIGSVESLDVPRI